MSREVQSIDEPGAVPLFIAAVRDTRKRPNSGMRIACRNRGTVHPDIPGAVSDANRLSAFLRLSRSGALQGRGPRAEGKG